jgi:hypothetical protein
MARQVVGLFDSMRDAEAAVRDLQSIGISNADISFVGSRARGEYDETGRYIGPAPTADTTEAAEGAGAGATGGAVLGGLAGVLVGLGALAIPGIGPVLAAGPFAAAIGTTGAAVGAGVVGAAAGAAGGGLLGALVGGGIPEEDAQVYAEGIRRGGTLVMARVDDDQVDAAIAVMDRHNVVDVDMRRSELQASGWTRYDETAGAATVGSTAGGVTTTPSTSRRARHYTYQDVAGTQREGAVESGRSRVGNAIERGLNTDLDRDRDVGVRDTRDSY